MSAIHFIFDFEMVGRMFKNQIYENIWNIFRISVGFGAMEAKIWKLLKVIILSR